MRRPGSIATSLALVLTLTLTGCNGVVFIAGTLGDASITGQVSTIRITFVSNGSGKVNVTIVTFIGATFGASTTPTPARDITFCGHIADRFTMNAVHTVEYRTGSVCGTVVTIVIP